MCALPQDKYTNLFLGFGLEDQGSSSLELMYTQTKNKILSLLCTADHC